MPIPESLLKRRAPIWATLDIAPVLSDPVHKEPLV